MKSIQQRGAMVVSSLAVLLALVACDRADNRTVGERLDSGVNKTQRAGAEAKRDADPAKARTDTATNNAAESTRSMGAPSAKANDASITAKVNAGLAKDKDLSATRIDVDTKDGIVTLSGPAPSATAKQRAGEIARGVSGVTSVNNQLTIKAG